MKEKRARSSARIEHRAFKQASLQRNPGVPGSIPGGPASISAMNPGVLEDSVRELGKCYGKSL